MSTAGSMQAPSYVPPRSVGGRIEQIACAGAKRVPVPGMASSPAAVATILPETQWIANCIRSMETPKADEAYTHFGKQPPSREENMAWCSSQYPSGRRVQ